MRRAVTAWSIGLGSLVGVVALAAGAVYLLAEWTIQRQYDDVPLSAFAVPADAAAITRGQRLATVYGCNNSCHGKHMEGSELYDEPGIAKINAPNLTRVRAE